MEKVTTLIQKLQQQLDQKATAQQLLITVQMLQAELILQNPASANKGSNKVVVIMPAILPIAANANKNETGILEPAPINKVEEKIIEILQVDEKEIEAELEEIKRNAASKNKLSSKAKPVLLFDPVEDVPTLTHQTPQAKITKEINEAGGARPESLNERLKQSKTEVSEKLTEGPIKDLKKAIGVNDRFLFISELFRGDEAMYERSIKTINNFSIFPEAEYWIKRELKLKIGWNENEEVVKQFDQLVRRRFS